MNRHSQATIEGRSESSSKNQRGSFIVPITNDVIREWKLLGGATTLLIWAIDSTTLEETNAETGITEGQVYGGSYCCDSDIARAVGCHAETISKWRKKLVGASKIRVKRGSNGHQYIVLNSRKWIGRSSPKADSDPAEKPILIPRKAESDSKKGRITDAVSFNDNTKTSKRKSVAKNAPSSQKDFRNPKIKEFLEFWSNEYEQVYERKPTLNWGKEINRLDPVFTQHDEETVKAAALGYLADRSDWIEGHGLGPFVTQFDKWLSKATRGDRPRPATPGIAGRGKFDELLTL